MLFLSLVFEIESFLIVEEDGIAADEGGGDQYFAIGTFEGGMIDFRLRVKHFPAVFDKFMNAIEITVIVEIYFFEIELLWLHLSLISMQIIFINFVNGKKVERKNNSRKLKKDSFTNNHHT